MAQCPKCHHDSQDDAKYCAHCGNPLGSLTDAAAAFEIGKIAALATIKRDILTWFGGGVSIIGIVLTVFAFLGMNEVVKSSVSTEIRGELDRIRENIDKTRQDLFIDVGKSRQNQEQIALLVVQAGKTLDVASTQIES